MHLTAMECEEILIFRVEQRLYALRLSDVKRILPLVTITPLKAAPDHVVGMLNLANDQHAVIDVTECLGQHRVKPYEMDASILLLENDNAIVVDDVIKIASPPFSQCLEHNIETHELIDLVVECDNSSLVAILNAVQLPETKLASNKQRKGSDGDGDGAKL